MLDSGCRIYGINDIPGIFVREKMAIGGKISNSKDQGGGDVSTNECQATECCGLALINVIIQIRRKIRNGYIDTVVGSGYRFGG